VSRRRANACAARAPRLKCEAPVLGARGINISVNKAFWRERRVFLTGHTGFKGAWLSLWLSERGAKVTGVALPPHTEPSLFGLLGAPFESIFADVRNPAALKSALLDARPQIVIHMAAQALVRESYRDPVATFDTNVMGTAHLLDACRGLAGLQGVLIVTSDKVYENDGAGRPFGETDRLGGHDPYSSSKACTELLTQSFRDSFFADNVPVISARAGNVIGGGDWSADRLIPDCVRALDAGLPVSLRYPDATRPWQHVLEPLGGYLTYVQGVIENRGALPSALNFGPDPASFCSVSRVVDMFSARFDGKPGWCADTGAHAKEASTLTLTSALAQRVLAWSPRLEVAESIAWTADWYRAFRTGDDMREFTRRQIADFEALPGRAP
jgi:CDP-glucose 4,6-dehydratase